MLCHKQSLSRMHLRVVVHAVCICEDASALDYEAAAAAAALPLALPRQGEVGLCVDAEDLGVGGGRVRDGRRICQGLRPTGVVQELA